MLISKKTGEHLMNAFKSDFTKNAELQKLINEDSIISSVNSLKNNGFFKKIITVSKPIIDAYNRFKDKISKNRDILFEWAKEKEDFKMTLLFYGEPFFVEKQGMVFHIISVTPCGKEFTYIVQDFSKKNNLGLPESVKWEFKNKYQECSQDRVVVLCSFCCLFSFLKYTDIQEKVIKAKSKEKKPKKLDRDINLSDFDVSVLSSTYYTKIYVEGAIGVSGHFKLQPCGENGKDRKLIEIMPYTRNGYTRRSDIELGKAM